MTAQGSLQLLLYIALLVAAAKPLGIFMAAVYEGRRTWLTPVLGWLERGIYRVAGIDEHAEGDWRRYTLAALLFNVIGFAVVYLLQRLQGVLPLNPQGFAAVSPDSSFNTAVSFATNTNWQGYVGEATMSYLTQMLGLGVQNFLSAATGMAVLVALIRGFARRETDRIGNFYVDVTRSTLYILLPLALVLAVVLMSQGVVQSFAEYRTVSLLDPVTIEVAATDAAGEPLLDAAGEPVMRDEVVTEQTVPLGPAASQVAIKQLGTNGGGFFNVNSAHPFENPTPLSNLLEVLAILLIPGRALLHVRPDGPRHAARLGRARGDARDLRAADVRRVHCGAVRQPRAHGARRGSGGLRRSARRQHGGQGGALRHRELRRSGPRRRRRPRTAPSTRCTIPTRRSAGSCRCGSCSSARSCSAASAAASTAC